MPAFLWRWQTLQAVAGTSNRPGQHFLRAPNHRVMSWILLMEPCSQIKWCPVMFAGGGRQPERGPAPALLLGQVRCNAVCGVVRCGAVLPWCW